MSTPENAAVDRLTAGAHHRGFWVVFATFLLQMAFSTIPTPLYALYQARDGFPTFTVTVIFAVYAVGVALSLLFVGHISDWVGRKPMLLITLALSFLSALVFLVWNDVAGLIVARFVNGLAIGALTATATAHLAELEAAAKTDRSRAAVAATFANMGGLGLGPILAGLIASSASAPLIVPYAAFGGAFIVLFVLVLLVPETVQKPEERPAYRPQRIAVPPTARATFWAAGAAAFAAFSLFGLMTALGPTFLAGTLGNSSRIMAGLVPFLVFTAAALAQIFTGRLAMPRQIRLSLVILVLGLVLVALAAGITALWLFLLGAVVAGAGAGILFRAALGTVASAAEPHRRGEALAGLFLIAYIGLTVPVILIGVALQWFAQAPVLIVFTAVVAIAVAIAGSRMLRR